MLKPPSKINKCLAAASLLVVFIIDVITPTEFVADILYLCCILLVFKEPTRTIISFSIGACLMIIIDVLFVDRNLKVNLPHLINRGMSILVILIISYTAILYRKLNQANLQKEQRYLKAIEEMIFITSHQVRKPVANILGLINILNNERIVLTPSELKDTLQYLLSSANEMDSIIKELNIFIEKTGQQNAAASIVQPKEVRLSRSQSREYSIDCMLMAVAN